MIGVTVVTVLIFPNSLGTEFILERMCYEKYPHVSGYYDGDIGKSHGVWLSLGTASRSSGPSGTSAYPGSRQIDVSHCKRALGDLPTEQ
jgi:hypothetical protein